MLNEAVLEQRLSALEQAVHDLQQRLAARPTSVDWLGRVTGSVTDEAAFLEALEFGQVYRRTGQLPDEADDGS